MHFEQPGPPRISTNLHAASNCLFLHAHDECQVDAAIHMDMCMQCIATCSHQACSPTRICMWHLVFVDRVLRLGDIHAQPYALLWPYGHGDNSARISHSDGIA